MKNSFRKMKKFFTYVVLMFVSTCLLLLLLEGACFLLGFPKGTSDYVERAILQQKLEYRKPAGQYRVFVFGESTVHGCFYAPTSSLVKWLDAYVRDFLPGRDIKIVNFGRNGEGSDFITQAFSDTLQYKPDLTIFYLGHNLFSLASRVDIVRKREAGFTYRLRRWFCESRLISALIRQTIKLKILRHSKETQDLMGDTWSETITGPFWHKAITGPDKEDYLTVPGMPLYKENIGYFRENIEKIVRTGETKQVPVLFMKPVCNLKDYRPNASIHRKVLTAGDQAQWEKFYRLGQEAAQKKDELLALEFFEKALTIDPTYADLSFRLGQLYFQRGDLEKARIFFSQARDNDAVIRRAPQDVLNVYDDLVQKKKIHYFDTEKALIPEALGGILGWPLIEDNVHFSLEGQARVGRVLAETLAENNWLAPLEEWRFDRERTRDEISKALGITDETIFFDYTSMISYLGDRYDTRLEFAQRAWELFPDHPMALRQLAWNYWLAGDKVQALKVYKILGEKHPKALEAVFQAQPGIKKAYEAAASQSVKL